MPDTLSDTLVERLRGIAADPTKRCDTASMHANSVSSEDLWAGMRSRVASHDEETQKGIRDYLEGVNSPFNGMMVNALFGDGSGRKGLEGMLGALMGGKPTFGMMNGQMFRTGGSDEPAPASPPATEEQVEAAEAALGFALPAALRRFYLEVANGGVGMGEGIYSLDRLVEKYRKLTREPAGPQGQDWPANLLPIQGEDYELVSIDRDSGKLIFWDMEELDDDEDLPPENPTWAKSFKPEADSLEAWLSKWMSDSNSPDPVPESPIADVEFSAEKEAKLRAWLEAHPSYAERRAIFSMTAEEREAIGFPESGWKERVWDYFDYKSMTPRDLKGD